MEKEKYYVNLQDQEISQVEANSNHGLNIYATKEEVAMLRKKFDTLHSAEFTTFLRSFVPIKPYHKSESNKQYDESFTEVAKILYDLGDESTKQFIHESGMIGHRPIDTDYSYPDPHHNGGKKA